MLSKMEFRVATGLSILILVLVVINGILVEVNRMTQIDLLTRGQYIQQSVQIEPVYQALVRSLAEAAVNGDEQIGTLLTSQDISFRAQLNEGGK
jgi:hypothetical protein